MLSAAAPGDIVAVVLVDQKDGWDTLRVSWCAKEKKPKAEALTAAAPNTDNPAAPRSCCPKILVLVPSSSVTYTAPGAEADAGHDDDCRGEQ
jgi:hypothetical protein